MNGFVEADLIGYADPALYIGVDDQLLLQAISNVASQVVTVNYRILRSDGAVVPGSFTFTTGSAVTVLTKTWQLAQGFLLGFEITCPAAATAGQWLYAKMGISRGGGSTPVSCQPLFGGYVGSLFGLGYPGRPGIMLPTEGLGTVRSIQVANPGAGNEWLYTVPANTRQRLVTAFATFTLNNGVNIVAGMKITDGTYELAESYADSEKTGTGAGPVTYQPGVMVNSNDPHTSFFVGLHENVMLGAGYTIGSITAGLGTTDTYTNVSLEVLEWCELL